MLVVCYVFFFNETATPGISTYGQTLPLHVPCTICSATASIRAVKAASVRRSASRSQTMSNRDSASTRAGAPSTGTGPASLTPQRSEFGWSPVSPIISKVEGSSSASATARGEGGSAWTQPHVPESLVGEKPNKIGKAHV